MTADILDLLQSPATVFYEYKADDGKLLKDAAAEIERLRKLVQDLIDNDPNEIISDAGHSLLDLWRHDARKALGPQTNGEDDAQP